MRVSKITALPAERVRAYSGLVFERFTDRARRVVVYAQEEARMLNHDYIGTEHILLGLIHEGEGVSALAFERLGISQSAARKRIEEIIGLGQQAPKGHIPFTPRAKKVLELALREALQLGHTYIGTEHILLGLIREGQGVAAQVLQQLGADFNRVRETVIELLSSYTATAEVRRVAGEGQMVKLTSEVLGASEPPRDPVPLCPSCSAAIEETLDVRELETTIEGDGSVTVRVAYCSRCGVVLGVLG